MHSLSRKGSPLHALGFDFRVLTFCYTRQSCKRTSRSSHRAPQRPSRPVPSCPVLSRPVPILTDGFVDVHSRCFLSLATRAAQCFKIILFMLLLKLGHFVRGGHFCFRSWWFFFELSLSHFYFFSHTIFFPPILYFFFSFFMHGETLIGHPLAW